MGVTAADIIKKCIELGLMVSINQRLEQRHDHARLDGIRISGEVRFGDRRGRRWRRTRRRRSISLGPPSSRSWDMSTTGKHRSWITSAAATSSPARRAESPSTSAPIWSTVNERRITFLDTPGHEAFTAMRARGAQLTDIVVLVVAADDNVMPQTVEAISHAQAANVPIIIAINKTDKADANRERIRQQLSEKNVLVEEWGGKYQCVEISARTGKNVDLLLEKILLEADVLDLKANARTEREGRRHRGQGRPRQGHHRDGARPEGHARCGRLVRRRRPERPRPGDDDERGHKIEAAGPSTPVQILGFDGIPQAGDSFIVTENEAKRGRSASSGQQLKREQDFRSSRTSRWTIFQKRSRTARSRNSRSS